MSTSRRTPTAARRRQILLDAITFLGITALMLLLSSIEQYWIVGILLAIVLWTIVIKLEAWKP